MKISILLLLLISTGKNSTGKENVIFEQIGELAGSTSYLHAHVTISLSSIKGQVDRYRYMLEDFFSNKTSISNFLKDHNNSTSLKAVFHNSTSEPVFPYVTNQWIAIARLHRVELFDLEEHLMSLINVLPDFPDSEAHKNRIYGEDPPTSPRPGRRFPKQQEHLPAPQSLLHTEDPPHSPDTPNSTSRSVKPSKTTTLYLTPSDVFFQHPFLREKRFAGVIALPLAIAATAMGIYNTAQINFLKTELTQVQENSKRLFEVVSSHEQEFAALNGAIRNLATQMTTILMSNPTLLDARLSRIEAQIRNRLRMATHAIQAGQHRRLAVDYLTSGQIRQLFSSLQLRAAEFSCELLIAHHSDLFQIEVSLLFDGLDMHLLLHVPMVPHNSLLRLFKLHPFPLPFFTDHFLMPDVQNDILAVSSNDHRFSIQLSSVDLLGCHRMNQVFMCSKFGVLSRQFNQTCLGALFNQDFVAAKHICKFTVTPVVEKVMQLRHNWFVAYLPSATTCPIKCMNGSASELHLSKGSQRFYLSPGCEAHFREHKVSADLSIQMPNDLIHYEWDWEPTDLIHLPHTDIEEQLQQLKEFGLHRPTLTSLQYLAHQFTQEKPRTLAHWFHTAGNIILALIIISLTLFVCYRCYKWKSNKSPSGRASSASPDSGSGAILRAHAASILMSGHPSVAPRRDHVRYSVVDQNVVLGSASAPSPHEGVHQQVQQEQERQVLLDRLNEIEAKKLFPY